MIGSEGVPVKSLSDPEPALDMQLPDRSKTESYLVLDPKRILRLLTEKYPEYFMIKSPDLDSPKPISVTPIGKPLYYTIRFLDWWRRHPEKHEGKELEGNYYLNYGFSECVHCYVGRNRLSPEGKTWFDKTGVGLQQHIEDMVVKDTDSFAELENNHPLFRRTLMESHINAYVDSGLAKLPPRDLFVVATNPYFRDLVGPEGLRTALQIVSKIMPGMMQRILRSNPKAEVDTFEPDRPENYNNPAEAKTIKPAVLKDFIGPFYWCLRIQDCIDRNIIPPAYYELAYWITSNFFFYKNSTLGSTGKDWSLANLVATQNTLDRILQEHNMVGVEENGDINRIMLEQHPEIYKDSGFSKLTISDIANINKMILSSIPPEVVFRMKSAFHEATTVLKLLTELFTTRVKESSTA